MESLRYERGRPALTQSWTVRDGSSGGLVWGSRALDSLGKARAKTTSSNKICYVSSQHVTL